MYDTIANKVFPFIKKINGDSSTSFAKYMGDAMFTIPTPSDIIIDPACGERAIIMI